MPDSERGPKGDHGQRGETGATGPRARFRFLPLVGYGVLVVGLLVAFYQVDQANKQQAEILCRSQYAGRQNIADVLTEHRSFLLSTNQSPEGQVLKYVTFLDEQIANYRKPPPCAADLNLE